ncbi:MAG: multicomponent Na+:H+ antiporter subunit [Thermosediminibacterales bacterium]|nr:multicomponent Na+:H+ antiporter subunit [Thermosediminibacterales bacterium]MDK2836260.1 multicomponent Na+:H+ antiporter subunit [Thermosediminibacterales bacterium]
MLLQFIVNVLIAFVWMLLHEKLALIHFVFGYVLGAVVITVFQRKNSYYSNLYLYKLWVLICLTGIFIKELIIANFIVAWQAIKPELSIKPGIIALPLNVKKDWQITLLAGMITLTPGTLSVDVSEDKNYLFVHFLDIQDPEKHKKAIKETFEKRILEVSR